MIYRNPAGKLEVDVTFDASRWGLFAFGLYAAEDPRLVSTMTALKDQLWVKTKIGGLARYEDDPYHRVSLVLPGNPWFIRTLWLADYLLEQSDAVTGEPLSVSPLTWSHATYITSVHRLLRRLAKISAVTEAGAVLAPSLRHEDWIERLYAQACDSIHGICKL
ncbi:MAG: hypothetical protein BZ151_05545 [Desulfobacca sp. 4484_104]|nr:MAG: hypothetical protein BZ151_05545 [Desulfobacca sp. 4484_104]